MVDNNQTSGLEKIQFRFRDGIPEKLGDISEKSLKDFHDSFYQGFERALAELEEHKDMPSLEEQVADEIMVAQIKFDRAKEKSAQVGPTSRSTEASIYYLGRQEENEKLLLKAFNVVRSQHAKSGIKHAIVDFIVYAGMGWGDGRILKNIESEDARNSIARDVLSKRRYIIAAALCVSYISDEQLIREIAYEAAGIETERHFGFTVPIISGVPIIGARPKVSKSNDGTNISAANIILSSGKVNDEYLQGLLVPLLQDPHYASEALEYVKHKRLQQQLVDVIVRSGNSSYAEKALEKTQDEDLCRQLQSVSHKV